jgi:hypothetical protein
MDYTSCISGLVLNVLIGLNDETVSKMFFLEMIFNLVETNFLVEFRAIKNVRPKPNVFYFKQMINYCDNFLQF